LFTEISFMEKINAVITGIAHYLPDYILSNEELSQMVNTNDEWIMTHIGVRNRHILNEEGLGASYMARKACKRLLRYTHTNPDDIELLICATTTADYQFPSTASILCDKLGLKNAFAYDLWGACSGFLYSLETAANFVRSGRYKKVVVVASEKLSSMVDYTDRATCPIFGDGAGAALVEATSEELGVMDSILRTDGKGLPFLHMKAGGSVCPPSYYTIDNRMHFIYQEGRAVYKNAVTQMTELTRQLMERNSMTKDDVQYVVPHQANLRIIEAVSKRLDLSEEQVLVNIENVGNTSGASIPICLCDYEDKLKKGDNIILTAFGAGFTFGSLYLKWGYDGKQRVEEIKQNS